MPSRISGQIDVCFERAETCRQLANDFSYDAVSRHDFSEMAIRWLALAKSYQTAQELSGYLEWQSKRVEPPPGFEFRE